MYVCFCHTTEHLRSPHQKFVSKTVGTLILAMLGRCQTQSVLMTEQKCVDYRNVEDVILVGKHDNRRRAFFGRFPGHHHPFSADSLTSGDTAVQRLGASHSHLRSSKRVHAEYHSQQTKVAPQIGDIISQSPKTSPRLYMCLIDEAVSSIRST